MTQAKEGKTQEDKTIDNYAVIETGGKQYRVSVGDKITVGKLDAETDAEVVFDRILAYRADKDAKLTIGAPVLEGATVKAKAVKQFKDKKLNAFKKIRRHGFTKKIGHRQDLTTLEVTEINV